MAPFFLYHRRSSPELLHLPISILFLALSAKPKYNALMARDHGNAAKVVLMPFVPGTFSRQGPGFFDDRRERCCQVWCDQDRNDVKNLLKNQAG